MKDGLENIDEAFKKAFDGFESNVDPSVWTNVQNAIGGGVGGTDVTPKVDPSAVATVATKSIITKIAVGVALVGTLGTAGYYVINTGDELDEGTTNEMANNDSSTEVESHFIEKAEPIVNEAAKEEKESAEYNIVVKDDFSNKLEEVNTSEDLKEAELNSETDEVIVKETKNSEANINDTKSQDVTEVESPSVITEPNNVEKSTKTELEETVKETQVNPGTSEEEKEVKEAVVDVIPNVITPNGDGFNDGIKITGEDLEKIELVIMDKTGKPVYRLTSIDEEWNGKDQAGNELIPGMYYMAGVVIDSSGNKKNIKQVINIIK